MGDLSPHFSRHEFACHHCGAVKIANGLVARLELLRARVGKPLVVVSGYRCPIHNKQVGGALRSRHLTGEAVDLQPGYCTALEAKHAGFNSIGVHLGKVVHVDQRRPGVGIFKDP